MPRVNYVKHARALYHTKPDIDPETGNQKTVLVFKKDGVTPKTDKRGNQIVRRLTVRDLDRPKPNLRCDFPGCTIDGGEIKPGTSYKFLALRFGQKNRHAEHPSWQHWEYSSSVAAQCARLQADMHNTIDTYEFSAEEDFESLKTDLAQEAQGFVDEREEALGNMPEQLQDGSQASEYVDIATEWVESIENADSPSAEFAAEDCDTCDGTGTAETECDNCGGTGEVDDDEPDGKALCDDCSGDGNVEADCQECDGGSTDAASEDWIEEARQILHDAVDEAQF